MLGLDADLDKEIAEALGDQSIESLMDQAPAAPAPKAAVSSHSNAAARAGDHNRSGTIMMIHHGDVLVQFGAKEQGVCPLEQFKEPPQPGQTMEFILLSVGADGVYQLAKPGGAVKANWDTLQPGLIVEAMVTGKNKGGLELEIAGHRAFMPVSQVDTSRVEDLEPYLNTKLKCMVTELDKLRDRIILSRRAMLETEAEENRRRLFSELAEGQEHQGVVRRIEKFGAFIELAPGVDGLLHVSDMSWARVKDPKELVQIGQQVTVKILQVDPEQQRISLGIKQVSGDPWKDAPAKYPPGSTHIGKVTRTATFGAFVELEPGVEGLVHVSQLAAGRVHRVEDVVQVGQDVTAQVLSVDLENRRISLSVKALAQTPAQAAEQANSASVDEVRRIVKSAGKARAMESLMAKFGDTGGLKGGIG